MSVKGFLRAVWWAILGLSVLTAIADADGGPYTNTIMHPDRETRLEWIRDFEAAPPAHTDDVLRFHMPLRGSLSLLGHLDYIPAERDQGACGNCWAWAGTGAMGIALNVEENVFDRLSVQFISLCNAAQPCCEGGWLRDLASFYSFEGYAIPWSNNNADWRNGDGNCNGACEEIATFPDYPIQSITAESILTHGVGRAQAISNIKNLLNQNRAVWFGCFMGTQEDWDRFYTFWNTQSEAALWNFDSSCDKPYTSAGGGHAVLCVGYDDTDPENSYWIMLNSWGTTAGRPNGLFRVDMDMNYDCMDLDWEYNLYWQTLDIEFDIEDFVLYVDPSASCGGHAPCYPAIQEAIDAAGSTATLRIAEGRYHEALALNSGKTLTLEGGWDISFTTQSSSTTIDALTVTGGSVTVEYINCQ
ncbi:MAG: C1 family peptidase [Desulfatiglandaceae bacterium]